MGHSWSIIKTAKLKSEALWIENEMTGKRTDQKVRRNSEERQKTGRWWFYSEDDGNADGDLSGTHENGIKIR